MCEYVFGGMDEARGAGGGGGGAPWICLFVWAFFVNCGTFYDYELIALPAPWIWFFFCFFLSRGWYLCTLFYSHTSFWIGSSWTKPLIYVPYMGPSGEGYGFKINSDRVRFPL